MFETREEEKIKKLKYFNNQFITAGKASKKLVSSLITFSLNHVQQHKPGTKE